MEKGKIFGVVANVHILLVGIFSLLTTGKGGIQSKKNKKNDENSAFGVFDPPPPNAEKYNLLFLSFWHHSEQLWKNSFFPLEKVQKKT